MQVVQGQVLVRVCALVQAAIGCCILLLLVPTMVLTLCDLRWWCFSSHQLAQIHDLHSWWSSPATCASPVLSSHQLLQILHLHSVQNAYAYIGWWCCSYVFVHIAYQPMEGHQSITTLRSKATVNSPVTSIWSMNPCHKFKHTNACKHVCVLVHGIYSARLTQ